MSASHPTNSDQPASPALDRLVLDLLEAGFTRDSLVAALKFLAAGPAGAGTTAPATSAPAGSVDQATSQPEYVPAPGEPFVVTSDGRREPVRFDKITDRLRRLASAGAGIAPAASVSDIAGRYSGEETAGVPRALHVDVVEVARRVIAGMRVDGESTADLDAAAVGVSRDLGLRHPDYDALAARLVISRLQKRTPADFAAALKPSRSVFELTGST